MNKPQKQIIFIELVIVGSVIWRYLENSLTFNSALTYTLLYVICMFGWFYFRGKQHLYHCWFIVDRMLMYNLEILKLFIYNNFIIRRIKTTLNWSYFKRIFLFISILFEMQFLYFQKQACEYSIHIKISFLQLSGLT